MAGGTSLSDKIIGYPSIQGPQTTYVIHDEKHPLLGDVDIKQKPVTFWRKEIEVIILMILVIIFGALNRVASKIMTKPMGAYSFFLSLFNGVAYCILYFGILIVRYYTGRVSHEDIVYPWTRMAPVPGKSRLANMWNVIPAVKYFIIIGFMDGLGNILGLIPTPYLTGPMMSVVSQLIVVYSVICSILILRTRYTLYQCGSVSVVLAGALIALIPGICFALPFFLCGDNPLGWLLLYAASTIPNAISFTIKELVFRKKKNLEVFVVNSTGSLFQLLWWPVMVPITVYSADGTCLCDALLGKHEQTNGLSLWQYMKDGFECFSGRTPVDNKKYDCTPNPYPYLVYIVLNLTFNIFLLVLLKRASSLQGFMAIKAILPIAVILFLIPWPLIGSSSINVYTIISLFVILIGLGLYRFTTVLKERDEQRRKAAML